MGGGGKKSVLDSRGWIIAISLIVSLGVHAGVVLFAPRNPPPPPRVEKKVVKPVPVSIRKEQIRQIEKDVAKEAEPKPPEKKPEPPKPVEKKPEPPKPVEKKPEPPKPPVDRPPPVEKPPETPPAPVDNKPKPFVLKNVALKGGVAVQTGEDSNLFGDPSVDAKGFKKGIDAPTVPGTEDGSTGGGGQPEKEQVVIRQPKALNDVKGEYPPEYKDLRRVVRVELILTIDAQGGVRDVKIKKGAEQAFNESAIRAVRQLKFEPATRNGTPIAFNLKWTVVFIPEGN